MISSADGRSALRRLPGQRRSARRRYAIRQSDRHASPLAACRAESRRRPTVIALYVTNAWSDTVSVIDAATLQVVQTLPTGFEPTGVVSDSAGATLYVANRLSSDISVIDLKSGQEIKRLVAGRGASYLAFRPTASGSTAPTFIRIPERFARRRIQKSPSSTPRGRWWSSASRCTTWRACFMWRFRQTASSAWPRNFAPRI